MSKTNAAGRKGPKVKVIILLIVLAIVIGFVAMMIYSASMMSGMTMAEVTELQKKNIENTISVSGIVESRTFEKVSANLQYNVETVNVEVGDKVKKGDILATLNSDDLQNQIIQQQASIDSSNINTEYSLTTAEKNYNEALRQINDGTYPEIRNAKMNLDSAEDALKKAQDKYDEQLAVYRVPTVTVSSPPQKTALLPQSQSLTMLMMITQKQSLTLKTRTTATSRTLKTHMTTQRKNMTAATAPTRTTSLQRQEKLTRQHMKITLIFPPCSSSSQAPLHRMTLPRLSRY